MKKITAIFLCCLMAVFLFACSTEIDYSFSSTKPWAATGYEKTVYKVTRHKDPKSNDKGTLIAEGQLTYELIYNADVIDSVNYSTLSCSYTLTFNDDADEIDRGKTDTITSFVKFQRDSLACFYSVKQVYYADRTGKENTSYEVTANYFDKQVSYDNLTLQKNQATLKYLGKDTKTMALKNTLGTQYDNEMLYYLARCKKLAANQQFSFKMTNIFDSFLYNTITTYTMSLTAAESNAKQVLDNNITSQYEVNPLGENEQTDDSLVIDQIYCFDTKLIINAEKSGSDINLLYSVKPFVKDDKEHSQVLTKFITKTYIKWTVSTVTEFTLIDFQDQAA